MAQLATFRSGTSFTPYMFFPISYILQMHLKYYSSFKDKQVKKKKIPDLLKFFVPSKILLHRIKHKPCHIIYLHMN